MDVKLSLWDKWKRKEENLKMALYDSPTSVNLTDNPSGLFAWLNDVTNFWFSNSLLMVIWVLFFMGFLRVNKDDFAGAMSVASYVTVVLAMIGWLANIVSGMALALAIGVGLISTAWLLSEKNGSA